MTAPRSRAPTRGAARISTPDQPSPTGGAEPTEPAEPAEPTTTVPDLQVGPLVARDIDLALFGVLASGQQLGADLDPAAVPPTAPRSTSAPSAPDAPLVSIAVADDLAASARASGALVLRDEELTPLARLDLDGAPEPELDATSASTRLPGRLTRLRTRESGPGGRDRVTIADLWPEQPRTVIVFGRPPVSDDTDAVRAALVASPAVLALVTDDPTSTVPTPVLAGSARDWLTELGLPDASVRTAPLAWRDPASNVALVSRLGLALGDSAPLFLDPDDGSAASGVWHEVSRALETGRSADDALDPLSPAVAARLRRWRRPRAERGLVVMFSGLSGSGKSTLARDVSDWVTTSTERTVSLLDGDVVRTMLSSGLGFSKADRELNITRIGYVGAQIARHGGIALCAPIAPYAATREAVRAMATAVGDFVLVHVNTPLEECERRDLKGLYAEARAGLIPEFTGISDPYEEPADADLRVDTSVLDRPEALEAVVAFLEAGGWVTPSAAPVASPTTNPSSRQEPRNVL